MSEVLRLDIQVQFDKPLEAVKEVLKHIRPTWDAKNVKLEDLSTGFVNKNYKIYDAASKEAFLLRAVALGHNPNLPVLQKIQHQFVHDEDLGPKLYCTLKNAVCVEFLDGKTMNWDTRKGIYDTALCSQTPGILAKYHTKALYEKAKVSGLTKRDNKDFDQYFVPPLNMMKNLEPDSDFCKSIPSGDEYVEERDWFVRTADKFGLNRRLVHMDANPTNWLVRNDNGQVVLIDYDLMSIFYPCVDIAWFFLTHADIRKIDLNDYPSIEYQRKWLSEYLAKRRELNGRKKQVTTEDVEALIEQVEFGLLYALLQVVSGGMIMRMIYLKTGKGDMTEQSVLVCWEAYKKKKDNYVKKGYS